MVANFNDESLTIPKATVLGIAEGISEIMVDNINAKSEANLIEPAKSPRKRRNETLYYKLLQGKLDHLTLEEREHIEPILIKYAHIFHDEDSNDFKGSTVIEHHLPVGDVQPIRRPQYRTPYALRGEMEKKVQKSSKKGSFAPAPRPGLLPLF